MPIDTSAESRAERIGRIEERLRGLDEKVDDRHEQNTKKLDTLSSQVSEIRELIANAKGARWALIALAGIAGYLSTWLHKLPIFPK